LIAKAEDQQFAELPLFQININSHLFIKSTQKVECKEENAISFQLLINKKKKKHKKVKTTNSQL